MGESYLQKSLQTSFRREVTGTFDASGTGVLDAGPGRSFVGLFIGTALAAGTTLTFKGYGGGDNEESAPAASALAAVNVENADGSAAAAYTIEADAAAGYFPLDAAVFNGCRFLQVLSDEDNTAATLVAISKAV